MVGSRSRKCLFPPVCSSEPSPEALLPIALQDAKAARADAVKTGFSPPTKTSPHALVC